MPTVVTYGPGGFNTGLPANNVTGTRTVPDDPVSATDPRNVPVPITGLLKGDGERMAAAVPGTDYVAPNDARLADTRKPAFVAGDGGTVVQATNKSTAVTLHKLTGTIQLAAGALAAGAIVTFVFNNSTVVVTDLILATHHATGAFGAYNIAARATGNGTASISVRNTSAASLNEAIVIKYAVVKSVVT